MKKLFEKLNSKSGASLVIALLFFLICIVVSSIILTAAAVNSGRTEKQSTEQQAYLSLSSAAQLLRDDFENLTPFVANKTETVYTCGYEEHQSSTTEWGIGTESTGSLLSAYVGEAALKVCKDETISTWGKYFEVTADSDELNNVTVVMTMDDEYNITCLLTVTDSSYSMKLYLSGTSSLSEEINRDDYCTHQTYELVFVGDQWEWQYVDKSYVIQVTTYSTTVTWAEAVITKEV